MPRCYAVYAHLFLTQFVLSFRVTLLSACLVVEQCLRIIPIYTESLFISRSEFDHRFKILANFCSSLIPQDCLYQVNFNAVTESITFTYVNDP